MKPRTPEEEEADRKAELRKTWCRYTHETIDFNRGGVKGPTYFTASNTGFYLKLVETEEYEVTVGIPGRGATIWLVSSKSAPYPTLDLALHAALDDLSLIAHIKTNMPGFEPMLVKLGIGIEQVNARELERLEKEADGLRTQLRELEYRMKRVAPPSPLEKVVPT